MMPVETSEFSQSDLTRFREYIRQELGISIPRKKDYLVESKLRKALDLTGFKTLGAMLKDLDETTRRGITQAVTTNHTFFFREAEHFDTLIRDAQKRGLRHPLIWCAASSSGEEPYSLAIRLLEAGFHDFLIVASDIDRQMLGYVHQGLYPENRLSLVTPPLLEKYFTDEGITRGTHWYRVKPVLRERLVIKCLNLLEEHIFERPFDFVLCRNVLIYFDHATQAEVIGKVSTTLAPGGVLFLGHSESLLAIPHAGRFQQLESSAYRKLEGAVHA